MKDSFIRMAKRGLLYRTEEGGKSEKSGQGGIETQRKLRTLMELKNHVKR
jgi:hypothetical protein